MISLPIVGRELLVASRRRATYWGRLSAALIGVALTAWILITDTNSAKEVGADLFEILGAIIFLYAAVAGTLATDDCLSAEKREGTLGLLFLTDLKAHDVVLGKLAASSLNVFCGMVSVMPMLAIPFLLGGVAWAEMLRVVLVSVNLLFLFLCIGLFASALCRNDSRAIALSILIGLAVLTIGWVVALSISLRFNSTDAWYVPMMSSPLVSCVMAFDPVYNAPMARPVNPHHAFWFNVALTHFYAWAFLLMACWFVPRSWQDRSIKKPSRLIAALARLGGNQRALLESNPFLWRAMRPAGKSLLVWLPLAVMAVIWWWGYHRRFDFEWGMFLLLLTGLILKGGIAAEASRTLGEDKRSGALELLLCTPLRERVIVRGQLMALWRQFAMPAGALVLAWVMFAITARQRSFGPDFSTTCTVFCSFLVLDMIALSWVGMWLGLRQRKPNRAAIMALAGIMVLPSLAWVALVSVAAVSNNNSSNYNWFLWIALGLAADLGFSFWAHTNLRLRFREIVSEGVRRTALSMSGPR